MLKNDSVKEPRKLAMFFIVAALFVFSAPDAWGQGSVGTFKGTWSYSETQQGISLRAGGPISFRVNPEGGSFTCRVSGSGGGSGTVKVEGMPVNVKATETVSSSGCSGSYDPATGRIDGSITVTENFKFHMTVTVKDGKGKQGSQTQTRNDSDSWAGSITGTLRKSTGSGSLIDDEGKPAAWNVRGGFSEGEQVSDDGEAPDDDTDADDADGDDAAAEDQGLSEEDQKEYDEEFKDVFTEEEFEAIKIMLDDARKNARSYLDDLIKDWNESTGSAEDMTISDVIDEIEDPREKSAVARVFVKEKLKNNDKELTGLIKDIPKMKSKKKVSKKINKAAKAVEKKKSKGYIKKLWDKAKEKTWGWLKGKTADKLVPDNIKDLGDKADKVIETGKKIIKIKDVFDKVDKDVKDGLITRFTAKAIKGWLVLGNGVKAIASKACPGCGWAVDEAGEAGLEKGVSVFSFFGRHGKETDDATKMNFRGDKKKTNKKKGRRR